MHRSFLGGPPNLWVVLLQTGLAITVHVLVVM